MRTNLLSASLSIVMVVAASNGGGCAVRSSSPAATAGGAGKVARGVIGAPPEPRALAVTRVAGIGGVGMISDVRWVGGVNPGWLVAGVAGVAKLDERGRIVHSASLQRSRQSWTSTMMITEVDGRALLVPLARAGSSFNGIDVFAEDGSLAARFEPFGPDTSPFDFVAAVIVEESSGRCWCVSNKEKCALIDLRSMTVSRLMDWPRVNSYGGAAPVFKDGRLLGIATASGRACVMMSPEGSELWRKSIPGRFVQWVHRGTAGGQDVLEFASTRWGQTSGLGERWVLPLDHPGAQPRKPEDHEVVVPDHRDSFFLSGRPRRSDLEVFSDPPEPDQDGQLRLRDRVSGVEWHIPIAADDLGGPGAGHAVLRGGDLTFDVHRGPDGPVVLVGYGGGLFLCTGAR